MRKRIAALTLSFALAAQPALATYYPNNPNGQATSANSAPVVVASDQSAIATTGTGSVHLTATPTVTAGAYSSGYVVGGLISLSGATRTNSGSGLIQTVEVTVKTALTAPYDVLFFDTQPTNGTYTDNAAFALNTSDAPFLVGVAHSSDLIPGGTPQILQAANLALPFKLSASNTTLYAIIVMRGAETLASTSAIGLSVVIKQD
jgi:hypothetical protein